MWKNIIAATTALVIAGGSLAYAQQDSVKPEGAQRSRPSAEDITAYADARIAALHAGLKLNADQEKNWPAVESALRDLAKQRAARLAARASAQSPQDPVERLNLRADIMQQRGAALKKLAEAASPLYKSLNDDQKHRFVVLAQLARQERLGRMIGEGGRHGHRGRHHFGPRGAGGGQDQSNPQPQ